MNKLILIIIPVVIVVYVTCKFTIFEENKKVTSLGQVPMCSSGNKVEVDVDYLKKYRYEEYKKLPRVVRVLGFRPMICKPG